MDKSDTGGQPAKLYRNKETGELFTYRGMLKEGESGTRELTLPMDFTNTTGTPGTIT